MCIKQKAFLLFFLMCSTFVFGKPGFGKSEKINNQWKFILQDVKNAEGVDFNDKNWQNIDLPHDWSVKQQLSLSQSSCMGYLPGGIGWYRKSIQIPEDKKEAKVYLYFEGVYNRSDVYINGHLLGNRPNGYISFMYDATPYIKYGKENVIAVRVDHSRDADSRWYTGSGIYRDVWLVYANPVHIAQWGVYVFPEESTSKNGVLNVEVELTNELEVAVNLSIIHELMDKNGKVVAKKNLKQSVQPGESKINTSSLKVAKPNLWSIEDPYLYDLKTTVLKNGEVLDETITKTGFRQFTFDADKGFALNGKWMKVKGVCIHHDAGVLGAAVPKEVLRRRLINLKEIGCNAIRTSHNPQAPSLYELCDELGMLVINEAFDEWEFPKRKWLEGWNVGTPGFQGSFDFFEEWGERDLADMVKRDRNHISIFAWSIGNEVDYPNDPYSHPILDGGEGGFTQPIFGGYKKDAPDAMRLGDIAKRLSSVVKKYDKSRPVTAGLAGVAMSNETAYPGALDITGYNYTENMYDKDHKEYPDRVIFGSENRHDLSAWKDVRDKEFIFGQFIWTGIDYLGESGRWPSRGFYSGLLDFGGFIKPRGYFRQSLWSEKPMAYLGTYPTPGKGSVSQMQDVWSQLEAEKASNYEEKTPSTDAWSIWNYYEGQLIRVVSYSNAPKAKLLLNDKEVGAIQDYNDETGIYYWDIPFQDGVLKVIGMDENSKEICDYEIQSSGSPNALKIMYQDQVVKKDGVAQIIIQVVDEKGVPVMISDNEVTCQIMGKGKLLGLEASNNSDMSNYGDNVHRVYHGRMIAYIKVTEENKEGIKVHFTSPWLKSAEALIKTIE